jgi:hypothetical protein
VSCGASPEIPVAVVASLSVLFATMSSVRAQEEAGSIVKVPSGEQPEYPIRFIDRPLTLPGLMAEASLRAGYWWVEDEENASTTSVGASFGMTDWWQASVSTRFWLAPESEWGRVVRFETRVRAIDTARIDFAPGLYIPVVFDGDRDTEAVPLIAIDAHTRIRAFRKIAFFFGENLVPIGLGDEASASINLNGSFLQQLSDHHAIRMSMQFFHIRLHGDVRESGGPAGPISITALFAPTNWIEMWLGYQAVSTSTTTANGVIGGVAGRL